MLTTSAASYCCKPRADGLSEKWEDSPICNVMLFGRQMLSVTLSDVKEPDEVHLAFHKRKCGIKIGTAKPATHYIH